MGKRNKQRAIESTGGGSATTTKRRKCGRKPKKSTSQNGTQNPKKPYRNRPRTVAIRKLATSNTAQYDSDESEYSSGDSVFDSTEFCHKKTRKSKDISFKPSQKIDSEALSGGVSTRMNNQPFLKLAIETPVIPESYSFEHEMRIWKDFWKSMNDLGADMVKYEPFKIETFGEYCGLFKVQANNSAWFTNILRFKNEKDKLPYLQWDNRRKCVRDYYNHICRCVSTVVKIYRSQFTVGGPNIVHAMLVGFNQIVSANGNSTKHCALLMLWKTEEEAEEWKTVREDGKKIKKLIKKKEVHLQAVLKESQEIEITSARNIIFSFLQQLPKAIKIRFLTVYGKRTNVTYDEQYAHCVREAFKDAARVLDGLYPRELLKSKEPVKVYDIWSKRRVYYTHDDLKKANPHKIIYEPLPSSPDL